MMIRRIFFYSIAFFFAIPVCSHFLWFYCFPVPKQNVSKSALLSVQPGMASEQVILILGTPKRGEVREQIREGKNIYHYYQNDYVTMSKTSKYSTWIYSDERYLQKSLEIYINFINNRVMCVVAEKGDLALYLNCDAKKITKEDNELSLFLNK